MKRWLYYLQKYTPFGRFALPFAIVLLGVFAVIYDQNGLSAVLFKGWYLFVSCLLGLIFLIQIITAVLAAIHAIRIKARFREVKLTVDLIASGKEKHMHELHIRLQTQRLLRFLRPLVHLDYQDFELSPGIQLKKVHFVDGPKQWEGVVRWRNPLWVIHTFQGAVLRFEDVLGVCSFPVFIPKAQIVIPEAPILPLDAKQWPLHVSTQELDDQILKKALSDDYLHLKSYEPSDDVRRIIWRLFAKDRSLYTRTPDEETHVKERLSFYIDFSFDKQVVKEASVQRLMLHHYKLRIVGLLKYLMSKEVPVNINILGHSYNCNAANWSKIKDALLQADWHSEIGFQTDTIIITQPFSLNNVRKDKDIVLPYTDFEKPYLWDWTKKLIFTTHVKDNTLIPRRYKYKQSKKIEYN